MSSAGDTKDSEESGAYDVETELGEAAFKEDALVDKSKREVGFMDKLFWQAPEHDDAFRLLPVNQPVMFVLDGDKVSGRDGVFGSRHGRVVEVCWDQAKDRKTTASTADDGVASDTIAAGEGKASASGTVVATKTEAGVAIKSREDLRGQPHYRLSEDLLTGEVIYHNAVPRHRIISLNSTRDGSLAIRGAQMPSSVPKDMLEDLAVYHYKIMVFAATRKGDSTAESASLALAQDAAFGFYESLKRQGGWRPLAGASSDVTNIASFRSGDIRRRLLLGRSRNHIQVEVQTGTTVADVGEDVMYSAAAGTGDDSSDSGASTRRATAKVAACYRDGTHDILVHGDSSTKSLRNVPSHSLRRRLNHGRVAGGDVLVVCVGINDTAEDVIRTIRVARCQHRERYPGRAHSVGVYGSAAGLLLDEGKLRRIRDELDPPVSRSADVASALSDQSTVAMGMIVPNTFLIRPSGSAVPILTTPAGRAALARADLTAVLWFAGAFEKLRALKPCVLEEMQGKTVIDKYSQREKEMSLIRSCTVPTSKVQPDGWSIRRTTDGTPYFTRFKPGNEPDPMYFQEEHSVSFKYPVRPFPVLAQNAMVRASRSVGRLYEPGRTFLQNPIVLIVEGIVRGWCATTNSLPRPMPVTQIWAAVSELQRSMTREGQAVLSEVDDLVDSIAEGKPSVLRKSTDLPGKLVWSRLVDVDKDFSAGPLGNEYASSALFQKMWPETIDEHDLGEDSTVRETAIRALSKLLTVYIENEYGQYLLRGDVKIARSWHYSTHNADYDADEFQNVLEKISVLIGHANEIKTSFQEKQAKQKRVALYPLTTTDLKKQAQRTGDANGAFKRRLGHLCVFKLGSTVTKKGKQSSKVHSDLGCLVFHDDPRKEEHAWDCSPELANTLRDIQINNVTVLNANDQFVQFFPAKPRNLAAKARVYHAPGTESKTPSAEEFEPVECLSHPSIALVFPDLQMIFARSNMMREITPLHFPHLSVLDLSNNELEALPHFDLPNLIHLDVSQNKLSGRLDVALGLVSDPLMHSSAVIWSAVLYKSLQYLDLSGNDFGWIVEMQMHAASVLGQYMPALKNLQLHDNPFVKATMGSFASIIEFRARFNSEMPELKYISPPVFSRRRRQQITSDNAERYLLDQDKSRGAILASRQQYEIWPSMRDPENSGNPPNKRRRSLNSRSNSKTDALAEENHFCGLMSCALLGKEAEASRRTVELYSQTARRASQRALAAELMYQHMLPSKTSQRTMSQQIAVSEMRRPIAKPMQSFPSFGFDGFLIITNAVNRINLKRAWTKLFRVAPRRAAPYSKGGREQGKPSGWYDSYRTQILNAKRVQYLLKHRVDGSRDGDTPSSILQKRNQILYRNAFMKMKCVRNMYRKKKCCDELLMRVTRTERDEEGPSLLETGPAGGGLGGGDEGGNMTATATNLQRHNALLEAKDLIVEKKLKLVRELKALFLKDIATFRRKAREQHAENERMITEYSTNIASLATELVPVLSQQQEILKLQQKVHDKRLESMKLENMYAHAMKKKGRIF